MTDWFPPLIKVLSLLWVIALEVTESPPGLGGFPKVVSLDGYFLPESLDSLDPDSYLDF